MGYSDGYGFELSVLANECTDGIACVDDTSGAYAGGQMISVDLDADGFTPYYIVAQGLALGGQFSLSIDDGLDGGIVETN